MRVTQMQGEVLVSHSLTGNPSRMLNPYRAEYYRGGKLVSWGVGSTRESAIADAERPLPLHERGSK